MRRCRAASFASNEWEWRKEERTNKKDKEKEGKLITSSIDVVR